MLIINADDWGRDRAATDTAWACYQRDRISSVTAMVFMQDSERAAELATSGGMEVGLHVNFTEKFNGATCPETVSTWQNRIRRFLRRSKYALLLYNPFLRRHFREVFDAQLKEFCRIYGRMPSHFDGHQHMHLSTNMLAQGVIPAGQKVRRSFSFRRGEKNLLNRAYRQVVDWRLGRRYRLADFFFALAGNLEPSRLASLLALAGSANVEVMTHTWNEAEYNCLMSEDFLRLCRGIQRGGYAAL
jgi:predicted glycoside hydrolase/deacetylase ChbG (UPF0249 family)